MIEDLEEKQIKTTEEHGKRLVQSNAPIKKYDTEKTNLSSDSQKKYFIGWLQK